MGRSQLKFTRRVRGRGGDGAGRGGGRGGGGGDGGGGGGRGGPSRRQQQVTKNLPSNDFRFQRGGSQGAGGGRGQEESDDLRAYAISTDSRTTAYHAGGWEGDEEAGPEGKEEALALPSLTLDLAALAEALSQLPAHVRLGGGGSGGALEGEGEAEADEDEDDAGPIDPAYTEGLRYRDGVTVRGGSSAAASTPPPTRKSSVATEAIQPPQPRANAAEGAPPAKAKGKGDDEALEALLGLSLDKSGQSTTKQPTTAAAGAAMAVEDDIDALLALGGGPPKAAAGSRAGATAGALVANQDDGLDDLLAQPAAKPPPPPQRQKGGKSMKNLSSMLDSGGY